MGAVAFVGLETAESPPHIGIFAALAPPASGLIVVALDVRNQQGQQGINDGRFAGSVFAGKQGGVSARPDAPDLIVEGAPVIKLQGMEPKAGAGTAVGGIIKQGFHVF